MDSNTIKVGFAQTDPKFGEREYNFKQVDEIVGKEKIDLLVLPELFASGYAFVSEQEARNAAEDLHGPTSLFLQRLAGEIDGIVIAGFPELPENSEENPYNSVMMVDGTGVLEVYRKIHLFNKEKLWFEAGDRPYPVVEIPSKGGIKVGMMICFDWIFPEAARTLALKGADLIAHPTNLVLPYCQNAMITRCLSNRVFAITCNRVGSETRKGEYGEDSFKFTGQSQITGVKGDILAQGPIHEPKLEIVEIDFTIAREKNLNEYNHLFKDRRTQQYEL